MSTPKRLTRRSLLKVGLGAAAAVATGKLFSQPASASPSVTPTQPEGPFYPIHQQVDKDLDLTEIKGHTARAEGEVIYVSGQVLDDHSEPVAGALVDIWQANKYGRYRHEDDPSSAPLDDNFQGWGQVKTDKQGRYRFKTIRPGGYPVDSKWTRPPHIHFKISRRGYHDLTTQMYFSGNALNEKDQLLRELAEAERGKVIVEFGAGGAGDEPGAKRGQFNIFLRTVRRG